MDFAGLFPAWQQWLSPYGRLCRKSYFASIVVYIVFALVIILPVTLVSLNSSWHARSSSGADLVIWLGESLADLALYYCIYCLQAKRLHDLGLPAVIALVFVIGLPVALLAGFLAHFGSAPDWLDALEIGVNEVTRDANIGVGAYLLLAPGERGDNRYGADPLATYPNG